jgi:phytoene dehydrogenase-like protein
VAERYDAAIIGAGADGLVAAALLARAGLRTVVLERGAESGGRLAAREFHPGFWASPFAGAAPPLPASLFWELDLARFGALLSPPQAPAMLQPGGHVELASPTLLGITADAERRRCLALAAATVAAPPQSWWQRRFAPQPAVWPSDDWSRRALADLARGNDLDLLSAMAFEGRAGDPWSPGSALALLAGVEQGTWRGGVGGLARALTAAARAAGAEFAFGRELSDIRCDKDRAATLALGDGTDLGVRAVISTLDVKRTFLSFFAWSQFPKETVDSIGHVRMAGATARLLIALGTPPGLPDHRRRTLYAALDAPALVEARAAWRNGLVASRLPLALRIASATDPSLAPTGAAVLDVTIGCVPHTPFDGGWTPERRAALCQTVLATLEEMLPGLAVVGTQLLVPPDMEKALGATGGDLDGGEIGPDQMFGLRPGLEPRAPRTIVKGLYLAGRATAAGPMGTGISGAIAARALIADLRAGRLP